MEDEAHFLLDCPMSRELRDKYLPQEILNNNGMSSEEKLIQILSNSDLKLTAKFISQSLKHREITLDVLNTLDDLTKNVENLHPAHNPFLHLLHDVGRPCATARTELAKSPHFYGENGAEIRRKWRRNPPKSAVNPFPTFVFRFYVSTVVD